MIKLIRPYIKLQEVQADFNEIFESGIFTRGPYCDQLVTALKEYTGAKHVFLATSATTALWATLKVLGVKPGDEVIVSDFSFPASANVIEDLGAIPVFADVSLETYNANLEDIERKLSPKTKAVMFVDALGNPSGIKKVREFCRSKKIPLVEDAACAMGSLVDGVPLGGVSDFTCFSFHPRKLLTAGEGGCICTNNDDYADQLKVKLMHGAQVEPSGKMNFVDVGFNFRMSELQATMVLHQLKHLNQIVTRRRKFQTELTREVEKYDFIPQKAETGVIHNVQSLTYTVPKRDDVSKKLKELGVESTLGTYSQSSTTYYAKKYSSVQKNSLFLQNNTLTLPCHDEVEPAELAKLIGKVFR